MAKEQMTRILVDISLKDVTILDKIALENTTSRAALIRDAVHELIKNGKKKLEQDSEQDMFGLWKNVPLVLDGVEYKDSVEYQRKIREEWE